MTVPVNYPPSDELRYQTLPNKVFIGIVLDRSGSMAVVKDATIEAFNGFVAEQQRQPGESYFTLAQFDGQAIDFLYEGRSASRVEFLNQHNYVPRGSTPLFDAIGIVADRAKQYVRPSQGFNRKVLVIQTDGQENASKEWSLAAVQSLLRELESAGWQIIYLGAGIDAFTGLKQYFGTVSAQSISYDKDRGSTISMGQQMANTVTNYMASGVQQRADLNISGTDVTVRGDTDTKSTSKPKAGKSSSKPKTKK